MMSWKRMGIELLVALCVMGLLTYLMAGPARPILDEIYGKDQWFPLAIALIMGPFLVFIFRATDEAVSMVGVALSAAVVLWGAVVFSWSLFLTGLIPFILSFIVFIRETKRRHEERIVEYGNHDDEYDLTPDEEEFLADLYDDLSNGGSD